MFQVQFLDGGLGYITSIAWRLYVGILAVSTGPGCPDLTVRRLVDVWSVQVTQARGLQASHKEKLTCC